MTQDHLGVSYVIDKNSLKEISRAPARSWGAQALNGQRSAGSRDCQPSATVTFVVTLTLSQIASIR